MTGDVVSSLLSVVSGQWHGGWFFLATRVSQLETLKKTLGRPSLGNVRLLLAAALRACAVEPRVVRSEGDVSPGFRVDTLANFTRSAVTESDATTTNERDYSGSGGQKLRKFSGGLRGNPLT